MSKDILGLQKQPPAPARPLAAPVLLLLKKLIEDAIHQGCSVRAGRPTRAALEAAAWIRRGDDTPCSFAWCCSWLGIHGCRALLHKGATAPHVPGIARLRQRLQALQDPLNIAEVGHVLLEHVRSSWRNIQPRSARHQLTAVEIEEVRARIDRGERLRHIAVALGCSLSVVNRISAARKLPRPEIWRLQHHPAHPGADLEERRSEAT